MKKSVFLFVILLFLSGCISTTTKLEPSPKAQFYRVKQGDTLYSISQKSRVPLRELLEKNKMKPPYALGIDDLVYIPPAPMHVVRKSETLYSIAKKYDVDVNALARQNNIGSDYKILVGQQLFMPGTVAVASAAPVKSAPAAVKQQPVPGVKPVPVPKTTVSKKPATPLPVAPAKSGGFEWPVKGKVISSFGSAGNGRHNDGINISVAKGTSVKAAQNGVVAYAGSELKGFGNLLLIKHADGWVTAYAHNDSLSVKRGDVVKKGEVIAKAGTTGNVKDPQVHFEIRKGSKATNPIPLLK